MTSLITLKRANTARTERWGLPLRGVLPSRVYVRPSAGQRKPLGALCNPKSKIILSNVYLTYNTE
jgi:hypothetical protein